MIEEIKALMPLLERISDGALWAFGIYMLVKVISIVIWPITLGLIVIQGFPRLLKIISGSQGVGEADLYKLNYKGKETPYCYIGNEKTLKDFLKWAAYSDSKYVHESDLRLIMKGEKP